MFVALTFVAFGCGTNFRGLAALVPIVSFKTLTLDVIPMLSDLGTRPLGCGDGEGLDTEVL